MKKGTIKFTPQIKVFISKKKICEGYRQCTIPEKGLRTQLPDNKFKDENNMNNVTNHRKSINA